MFWLAAIVVVLLVILCWGTGRCHEAKSEKMIPSFNARFQDSIIDKATDYYYDDKGLTDVDKALYLKMLGAQGAM